MIFFYAEIGLGISLPEQSVLKCCRNDAAFWKTKSGKQSIRKFCRNAVAFLKKSGKQSILKCCRNAAAFRKKKRGAICAKILQECCSISFKKNDNHFKAPSIGMGYKSQISLYPLYSCCSSLRNPPLKLPFFLSFLPKFQALGFHPTKLPPRARHSKNCFGWPRYNSEVTGWRLAGKSV